MNAANRPPLTPEPAAGRTFRTGGMDFSAALIASGLLRFTGAELEPSSRDQEVFIFEDNERQGPALELKFSSCEFKPCDPKRLFTIKPTSKTNCARFKTTAGGRYVGNGGR
jgi:hypothetical protein